MPREEASVCCAGTELEGDNGCGRSELLGENGTFGEPGDEDESKENAMVGDMSNPGEFLVLEEWDVANEVTVREERAVFDQKELADETEVADEGEVSGMDEVLEDVDFEELDTTLVLKAVHGITVLEIILSKSVT